VYLKKNIIFFRKTFIPFISGLRPTKKEDYLYFVLLCIAELIKSKDHLTEQGIEKIKIIKDNMNRKRISI
jgi:hypothetical protein